MKTARFLIFLILWGVLASCSAEAGSSADFPAYTGSLDGYEYYHTTQREQNWEEDILFLAEAYLNGHPLLADDNFYIKTWTFHGTNAETEYAYNNALLNPTLRGDFISQINGLIAQTPQLSDTQIVFEMQRIIASLHDLHSSLNLNNCYTQQLPLSLECLGSEDGYAYYVTAALSEYENILYGKLVSINDVPIDEIVRQLSAYVSSESEGFTAWYLSTGRPMIIKKEALQVIGVVEESADDAQLAFDLDGTTTTYRLPFVTQNDYEAMDRLSVRLADQNIPRYRYLTDKNYWFEALGENILYIRFYRMAIDPNQSLNDFVRDISVVLRDAPEPLDVVVDFRDNTGGTITEIPSLANAINQYASQKVYLLMNESSVSAGVFAPCSLQQMIEGSVLVGAPAGQFVRSFGGSESYTLPNSGYPFQVSKGYYIMASQDGEMPLMPDITIYQNIEDYKAGKDTVLEYILAR